MYTDLQFAPGCRHLPSRPTMRLSRRRRADKGLGGAPNLHAYVANDPVNFTDPDGLVPEQMVTGSRIPAKQEICGSCIGHTSFGIGPNMAAERRRNDSIPWTATGRLTTYSDGTQSFSGSVEFGGRSGRTLQIGGGQLGTLLSISSFSWDDQGLPAGETSWGLAGRIAREEFERTRRIAPPGAGHNDVYDAERHARWTYRMARWLGPELAERYSGLHELQNILDGHPFRESRMDGHNNSFGIGRFMRGQGIPNIHTPGLMYMNRGGEYIIGR